MNKCNWHISLVLLPSPVTHYPFPLFVPYCRFFIALDPLPYLHAPYPIALASVTSPCTLTLPDDQCTTTASAPRILAPLLPPRIPFAQLHLRPVLLHHLSYTTALTQSSVLYCPCTGVLATLSLPLPNFSGHNAPALLPLPNSPYPTTVATMPLHHRP